MKQAEKYLDGQKTFQKYYESLVPANIYDFYGAWWVLQQPTTPKGNIRPQLKDEVENRFFKIKREVQQDLILEGIVAIIRESRHLGGRTKTTYKNIAAKFTDNGGVIFVDQLREDFNFDPDNNDHVIARMIFQNGFKFKDLSGDDIRITPGVDMSLYEHWVEENFPLNMHLIWPETLTEINQKFKAKYFQLPEIGEEFFDLMDVLFRRLNWDSAFGGKSWADITRSVEELMDGYPNNEFAEIDHVIDLAHNTNTWMDKFQHADGLIRALGIKARRETPKDWVDEISDHKVKAAVLRA